MKNIRKVNLKNECDKHELTAIRLAHLFDEIYPET